MRIVLQNSVWNGTRFGQTDLLPDDPHDPAGPRAPATRATAALCQGGLDGRDGVDRSACAARSAAGRFLRRAGRCLTMCTSAVSTVARAMSISLYANGLTTFHIHAATIRALQDRGLAGHDLEDHRSDRPLTWSPHSPRPAHGPSTPRSPSLIDCLMINVSGSQVAYLAPLTLFIRQSIYEGDRTSLVSSWARSAGGQVCGRRC